MTRIVILTALEQKERQFILNNLSSPVIVSHPQTGTDYYKANFNGLEVFVGRTDQTNINAAAETERALNFLNPSLIFFIGVAGGLKDVALGDLVIGQDVIGYETGKAINEDGLEKFKPRFKFGASSYKLVRDAMNFSESEEWKKIKVELSKRIQIFCGTIASGEKVNASATSDLSFFLKQNGSNALAIEMEGLGFLEVCRHYPNIPSLLIRGISDLVDRKEEADRMGSQENAMVNASAFLFGFIRKYHTQISAYSLAKDIAPSTFKSLPEVLCRLYPEGVKMNRVWQRAGGDLSLIALSNNAYTQWLDAIELVEQGGGGDVTMESLTTVLMQDFPNNLYVNELRVRTNKY